MNFTHRFEMRDGIPQIVIYAYTPVEYEFAEEFESIKGHTHDVANSIKSYAKENFSKHPDEMSMIILNGTILGSILVKDLIN